MKALSKRSIQERIRQTVKQVTATGYEMVEQQAPYIQQQAIAVFLMALALHGYGPTRLKRILRWYNELLHMPPVFGKQATAEDCIKQLRDKYDISLDDTVPEYEEFKDFWQSVKHKVG